MEIQVVRTFKKMSLHTSCNGIFISVCYIPSKVLSKSLTLAFALCYLYVHFQNTQSHNTPLYIKAVAEL